MLDFAHLPKPQNGTIDYFPGFSTTNGGQWEVWNKPKNCMFIRILCIGGGGGGGGGFSSVTTNARGGGGGGAPSGYVYVTLPSIFLPDRLYISTGVGGRGGSGSGISGNTGIMSYISIAPSSDAIYGVCCSSVQNGGQPGTNSAGGFGGSSLLGNINNNRLAFQGHFNAIPNPNGARGGAATGAVGSSISYPSSGLLLSGGAGGAGGAGFAGGAVNAPASQTSTYTIFPTQPGGVAGSTGSTVGGDGINGVELYQPLLATGGSGGGSGFDGTAGSIGGNGGNGGFGCGGGGGGAGTTGGRGGDGGPGLVVIHTW